MQKKTKQKFYNNKILGEVYIHSPPQKATTHKLKVISVFSTFFSEDIKRTASRGEKP